MMLAINSKFGIWANFLITYRKTFLTEYEIVKKMGAAEEKAEHYMTTTTTHKFRFQYVKWL